MHIMLGGHVWFRRFYRDTSYCFSHFYWKTNSFYWRILYKNWSIGLRQGKDNSIFCDALWVTSVINEENCLLFLDFFPPSYISKLFTFSTPYPHCKNHSVLIFRDKRERPNEQNQLQTWIHDYLELDHVNINKLENFQALQA